MKYKLMLVLAFNLFFQISNAAENIKSGPTELDLELAQKMAAKALACGQEHGWKLSVAIVNSEGNLIVFQRDNGAYLGSIQASMDKAKSANAFQRPTKVFADAIKEGRVGLVTVANVVGIEGGLPVQMGGKHAGAIGVSGAKATEDEQCAKLALE